MARIKLCGIYLITSQSGSIYVGQSVFIQQRHNYYKNLLCKDQPRLYNSIKKYGFDNHKFEIIHTCHKKYLNYWEAYYVKKLESFDTIKGLNMTSGGDSPKMNDVLRKKRSDRYKKLWEDPEYRQKMITMMKNRVIPEEELIRLKTINIGRKPTQETIEKIRKANTGKKCPAKGFPKSEEWKKKVSEKLKGRKFSQEHLEKLNIINKARSSKPILQYSLDGEFIKEWESISQIGRELNFCTGSICCYLKGKYKSSYGYDWRYKQ